MGLTFKEDCPDLRNTKVISMIDGLENLIMMYLIQKLIEIQLLNPMVSPSAFGGY